MPCHPWLDHATRHCRGAFGSGGRPAERLARTARTDGKLGLVTIPTAGQPAPGARAAARVGIQAETVSRCSDSSRLNGQHVSRGTVPYKEKGERFPAPLRVVTDLRPPSRCYGAISAPNAPLIAAPLPTWSAPVVTGTLHRPITP